MENIKICCTYDKLVKISDIIRNPKNRNTHPPIQIDGLCKTLAANGIRHPFIISKKSGLLITGHGRLEACVKLGLKELPVVYQLFKSKAHEYRFMIADNEAQRRSYLDTANFFDDLKEIGEFNLDLDKDLSGLEEFGIFDELMKPKEAKKAKAPDGKQSKITCPKCHHTFLK